MLGLKYIYRVDGDLLRQRLQTYMDTDGVEVDWGATQMLCGSNPEPFRRPRHRHARPRHRQHLLLQRTQGDGGGSGQHPPACAVVSEPTNLQEADRGWQVVYCNFHALAAGDMVGYVSKSFLPGLLLVGDAGGFAQRRWTTSAPTWRCGWGEWQASSARR